MSSLDAGGPSDVLDGTHPCPGVVGGSSPTSMASAPSPLALAVVKRAPLVIATAVFVVDAFLASGFSAGRPDYYYLADAFLHGRLWIDVDWSNAIYDLIRINGHVFVPFQPFPAVLVMPLVALLGVDGAIVHEPVVNAAFTGVAVALAWVLLGRLAVRRLDHRLLLTALFGFGTVIWNITARGGVWHTAEIVGAGLTLWALCETRAPNPRPWLLGLLGGAAFMSRSTLVFALPYYAWVVAGSPASADDLRLSLRRGLRRVVALALAFAPFVVLTLAYDQARFGSPFETGYALATLPPWLADLRAQGLFSIIHVPMNLELLFLHGPGEWIGPPLFFRPDPLGMSVLITSPALLVGLRMLPRSPDARMLGLAGLLVLVPTLLYYGGGWAQFGYRYLLDSIPFWLALCGLYAARRGVGWIWAAAIAWSVLANAWLTYWALRM